MAEINIDQITEEWKVLKDLFESGAGIDAIKQKLSGLGQDLNKFKSGLPSVGQEFKNVTDTANALGSVKLGPSLENWTDKFNRLKESAFDSNEELAVFAGKMLMLTPLATQRLPLPEAFKSIGDAAASSTAQISSMLNTTLKLFGPELSKLPLGDEIAKLLAQNAARADFAQNFENGFLMAASSSGEFSKSLQGVGQDLSGLSLKTEAYSNLVTTVADASGLSSTKVSEYAGMLRKIPGALDNFDNKSDMTIRDMHYLDAAIKVAAGTGQSFETVMGDLSFSFNELGTRGKKALDEVARMQSISDAVGLPMDKMRSYTQASAKEFKILGDNTQGAIDIMARFGSAFKDSGMGPEAIQEVVSGITRGISQMGTAQKAFLSSQTGGASGLQGAFQIDLALKQGKLGDVYKKVEDNLRKQFGGNVVTLEQASTDSKAAGQYQKQIQFVRSSAMGGIAKDDASAMKILDAFSKGQGGKLGETKSPEKAFADATKIGEKLQERQNNLMTIANNWAERQAQIQSIIAYNTARQAGNAGPLANYLQDLKKQSGMAAKEMKPISGQGLQGGRSVDDVMKEAYQGVGDKLSEIRSGAKQVFSKYQEDLGTFKNAFTPGEKPMEENTLQRRPTTSNEFAQRSLDNTDKIANATVETPAHSKQKDSKVNVAVTTVCAVCQHKIAQEEGSKAAKAAIDHYHQKGQMGSYHAGQTL